LEIRVQGVQLGAWSPVSRNRAVPEEQMSDESFFREVDQEVRQDRMKSLWQRYGMIAIAVAVAIVLLTAAFVGYRYWTEQRAAAAGDAFSAALTQADAGQSEAALEALRDLEANGHGAYPVLARMRMAALEAEAGDAAAAITLFDQVAADTSVPVAVREAARIRAAYLLVDAGSYDDVLARAQTLSSDDSVLRHSAREAIALAAWRAGEQAAALELFDQLADDNAAPLNMRQRAQLMSELIRGSGTGS
jgi:hypothetical protein